MPNRKYTFCRICEPNCPLVAEIDDDGAIARLLPDGDHPVSNGFACHKGLGYLDVNQDPARTNYPLRRTNPRTEPDGTFERVSWDDALGDIGARLRAIRDAHGPHAIATYLGNPMAFNTKAVAVAMAMPIKLGSRSAFGSASQDMTNKTAALQAIYGTIQWTIPDFAETDYLLCFGANPKVSHWTLLSMHRPLEALQGIIARGGTVRFINPRRIESATPSTGDVLQIRPDTDVYLLAALIHEIDRMDGFDAAAIANHGRNVDALRAFVARYPAHRVAKVTGIDAETIREMARAFMSAPAASVYMGTGVNQGRQGTLAYWLMNMLSFVTGNLGRKGGNYCAESFKAIPVAPPRDSTMVETPVGMVRKIYGQLPGNLMADLIESDAEPIRALIVMSGNPLLSIGGEERLRRAFGKLDLIVSLDLFRNATGEMADYVLPATDWLERQDMNQMALGAQPAPYVQIADPVVPPRGERQHDWWILARIEQELGLESVLDGPDGAENGPIDNVLARGGLTAEQLRAMPSQSATLPQADRENTFAALIAWPDKRLDCCPAEFADALERCETIFGELDGEDDGQLKLISLRTNYMHNSGLANMAALRRGEHGLNPLHMHPVDAEARGLAEGDVVCLTNANGCVEPTVTLDETLRPGVVAMSHGYGHQHTSGIPRASDQPGSNVNRLMPTGAGSYEKLSNMAHMNGMAVEVTKAAG